MRGAGKDGVPGFMEKTGSRGLWNNTGSRDLLGFAKNKDCSLR